MNILRFKVHVSANCFSSCLPRIVTMNNIYVELFCKPEFKILNHTYNIERVDIKQYFTLSTLRCLLIASTIFSVLVGACIWWVLFLAISIFYIDIINSFRIASYWVYTVDKIVKVVDVYHRRSPLVQGGLEPVGVCRDGTNWPSRMKLWFKRNTRNISMNLSQLLSLEDSGSEMELERS